MTCWKCGAGLDAGKCLECDKALVDEALKAINRAKERANNIGEKLDALRSKISAHISDEATVTRVIANIANALLILNKLETVSESDVLEVQQKAQEIISCAQGFLDKKTEFVTVKPEANTQEDS